MSNRWHVFCEEGDEANYNIYYRYPYENNYTYTNEISRTDELKLDKCTTDSYMIGRLRNYSAIKPTRVGSLQIFITPLCNEPTPVIELPVFNNSYLLFSAILLHIYMN